jgi:purine-binding chemotaxis protein CheW
MAHSPEIIFRLGKRRAALPLNQVREVILPGPLIRVPHAPRSILGAMNVRGRVVLVIDAGLLLNGGSSRSDSATERILVLDPRRRDLGLWVSEVLQIAQLGDDAEAAPTERDQLLDAEGLAQRIAQLFEPPPSSQDTR